LPGDVLQRYSAGLGKDLRNFDDVSRFVALAAELAGREIGRVGLDHDAVRRKLGGQRAQGLRLLEGQDTGERDRETQGDRLDRKLAPARIAMQHRTKGPLGDLLFEDAAAILICFAGMNDERQAG
jgi:hypothetical protein